MRATEILTPAQPSGVRRPPVAQRMAQRITQRIFEAFARLLCSTWCPLRVVGRENLPNQTFLLCANHASHMDTIVLLIATGRPFRYFATFAATDYFFNSRLRQLGFSCLLNMVPLDRSAPPSSVSRTLSRCAEFLSHGNRGLILFPEGTRSASGDIAAFKPAAALFSTRLGLPVVPVWIEGTWRLMPRGRFFPKRGPIRVRIGEPLWPQDDESIMLTARSRIMTMRESFRE